MISLHIVVDNCPQEILDRALLYLKRVNAPSVDIAAGAELLKGMQFAERVRRELPNIIIIWRNLDPEDTGIHAKYSVAHVYHTKVRPYLDWFQKNKIVFMPDNETSGDDDRIRKYAMWEAEFGVLLHGDKLNGAFCRFATGNIKESQYHLLQPVFTIMQPGDFISPNEYSCQPGCSSGGHLARYEHFYKAAGRELPTIIGEAGVAMNYDPGKGYIDAGMSDEAYAQQMLDEEIWYLKGAIDRHIFVVGAFSHGGFRLRVGVLEYWERYYANKPPPVIIEPPKPRWITTLATVTGGDYVTIRKERDSESAELGRIPNNVVIEYEGEAINHWWHVRYNGATGYVHDDYFSPGVIELPAPLPPTEPPTTIPPHLPLFPFDFEVRDKEGISQSEDERRIRARPALDSPVLGVLKPGSKARFIPLEDLRAEEKILSTINERVAPWQPVNRDGLLGWVWSGGLTWKPVPAIPPDASLIALKDMRARWAQLGDEIRRAALTLANTSDELAKDVQLLDAIITSREQTTMEVKP